MTNGLLIYGEIFAQFLIYQEALTHIWHCNCSTQNFLTYEEFFKFFYQTSEYSRPEMVTCLSTFSHDGILGPAFWGWGNCIFPFTLLYLHSTLVTSSPPPPPPARLAIYSYLYSNQSPLFPSLWTNPWNNRRRSFLSFFLSYDSAPPPPTPSPPLYMQTSNSTQREERLINRVKGSVTVWADGGIEAGRSQSQRASAWAESIEWFIEDQDFSLSYDSAPPLTLTPPLVSKLDTQIDWERETTCWREMGGRGGGGAKSYDGKKALYKSFTLWAWASLNNGTGTEAYEWQNYWRL